MDPLEIRPATVDDLPTIIHMLVDDVLGKQREFIGDEAFETKYRSAFEAICKEPNHHVMVAVIEERVVGTFHLSFIPGLTYAGRWRAQIEGVRVSSDVRGQKIGRRMMEWVIDQARQRDCCMVQLTSDKRRAEAIRFYEDLGFQASHEGFKLRLLS